VSDLGPISAPSLQELAYQRLRDAIEAGELQSREDSSGIGVRDLARLLDVSTTPVREALRRLQAEGLVVVSRRGGVRVLRLSAKDLQEIAELRVRLETLALERAIDIANEPQLDALAALVAKLDAATDPDDWREANLRFHMALYAAADYPRVLSAIRTIWVAVEPYQNVYTRNERNMREAQDEHRALLEAVGRRDKEAALMALTAHIRRAQQAFLADPALSDPASGTVAVTPSR
jgi:DNA-binding GntR family transcriptional regulator